MHPDAVTSERAGCLSYFTIGDGRQILPQVLTGLEMVVGRRFRVHGKMVRTHHDDPRRAPGWNRLNVAIVSLYACLARCSMPNKITRIVGVGDDVEVLVEPCALEPVADVAERGKILDRETHAVE